MRAPVGRDVINRYMKTKTDQDLKRKEESRVANAVASAGRDGLSRVEIVRRFSKRGTSDATLYRWIEASIATGKPGQAAVRAVKKAAAVRERQMADPARAARVAKAVTE